MTNADKSCSVGSSVLLRMLMTCCSIIASRLDTLQVRVWIQLILLGTGLDMWKKRLQLLG